MKLNLSLPQLAIHLVASSLLISSASAATVVFDFRANNGGGVLDGAGAPPTAGSNFDPSGVGDTITLDGLTTTIVDILVPEYDTSGAIPVLTGNTLSGTVGGVTTNISGQDALGVNNPSINNSTFSMIGGGTEASDFNVGESLIFSFDQDVVFTEIELESVVATDTFTVSVDGISLLATTGDDSFLDSLGGLAGLTIAAGSEITFAAGGDIVDSSFRIETFTVDVIPEPSSLALLALGGLMMAKRRRS